MVVAGRPVIMPISITPSAFKQKLNRQAIAVLLTEASIRGITDATEVAIKTCLLSLKIHCHRGSVSASRKRAGSKVKKMLLTASTGASDRQMTPVVGLDCSYAVFHTLTPMGTRVITKIYFAVN